MTEPLHRYTDSATGIYAECKLYTDPEIAAIMRSERYWFAYHPAHLSNPFEGAHGTTRSEAIAKVLAKHPELRRAA